MILSRRHLLQGVGATAVGLSLPWRGSPLYSGAQENDPHFFLQIIIPGGMDATYTFDARPLDLTAKGYLQNYIGTEPIPFTGKNGNTTLRTTLTDPFMPFMQDFSIINGVHMSTSFDGHEQNINFAMTGNPFGGDAFVPFLNLGQPPAPLDYLRTGIGNFLVDLTNTSNSITLSAEGARSFTNLLSGVDSLSPRAPLFKHIMKVHEKVEPEFGKIFSLSKQMRQALLQVPELSGAIRHLEITKDPASIADDPNGESILESASLIGSFFLANLTRSGIYIFNTDLNPDLDMDVHSGVTAARLPTTLTTVMGLLTKFLTFFKNTPFDAQRSLFDVTTFMICTEFSRTLRNRVELGNLDKSGSDHNPLNNTVLLGGKRIQSGLVLGASDFQTVAEIAGLPEKCAHRQLDDNALKIMGCPFDFTSGQSQPSLLPTYDANNYLNFTSITNTLFKVFGVDEKNYHKVERNGDASPILTQILA